MYLDHIFIKNSGAIEEIDLKLQFTEESTPKPTLIVGRNGTGKSNLLSYINDGLIEIAATRFADVAPITPQGSHLWHRRLGGDTRRAGTAYEFSTLKFKSENNIYQYIAKSGTIPENEA